MTGHEAGRAVLAMNADAGKQRQIDSLSPERQQRMATLALVGFMFEQGAIYWTVYAPFEDGRPIKQIAWDTLPAAINTAWEFATASQSEENKVSVIEAAIRKLDKATQTRMAKLSLDGARFSMCDNDIATVRNRQRFELKYLHYTWVDSSLDWLVAVGWVEKNRVEGVAEEMGVR